MRTSSPFAFKAVAPLSLAAVMLLVALVGEALAQRSDIVVRMRGDNEETLNGIIENFTRNSIEMQRYVEGGVRSAEIPIDDVRDWTINYRLRLRGQPSTAEPFRGEAFAQGREEMLNQNWSAAITHFSRAAETSPQDFAKSIARMHLVECGLQLGSTEATVIGRGNRQERLSGYDIAGRYADQFRREHPSSYFLENVLIWAGEAHERNANPTEAIAAYRALADLDEAQGNYRMAQLYFRGGDFSQARDSFRRARSAASREGNVTLTEACDVAIGRVNIELGNWNDARQVFERLVGDEGSHDASVLGTAYLGLGLCHANQQRWEAAFMALATAATAFKENISESDLQLALGLCVRVAERLGENDDAWQERAERLRREFSQRYRGSDLPELPR